MTGSQDALLSSCPPVQGRVVSVAVGLFLILVFFGLSATAPGLRITFRPPMTASSPGEAYFWLAHALLLFPASCLIGHGLAHWIGPWLVRFRAQINLLTRREWILAVVMLFVIGTVIARLGHSLVLYDFPITDDEYATEFGGFIFAEGRVTAPLILPRNAIPTLGLYYRDDLVARADWPGAQVVWAIAELSHLGSFVWAVVAAIPIAALAILLRRRLDAGWGFAAVGIFLCSPMALTLSMTSHAHLGSRAMLALALAGFSVAEERGSLRLWALTGLALGLAFLFRPLEIVFFSFPLLAWTVLQNLRRTRGYSRAVAGLVLGGLVPVLLMMAHAYLVTGHPLLPPRLDDPGAAIIDQESNSLWYRFGANTGYNTFMLAIWFLGPLGIVLVAAGAMTDRFTRLLGLGVLSALGLGLFHANMGLHIVGPIHYSECAVPLTIIAVHGLANLLRVARSHAVNPRTIASAALVVLIVGLGIFNLRQAAALQEQAGIQAAIYDWVDRIRPDPAGLKAILLAPQFGATWVHLPGMARIGSWVFEWRRPHPDLRDNLVILHDLPGLETIVRQRFPDRRLYRLVPLSGAPFGVIAPLDGQGPAFPYAPGPGG